MIDIYVTYPNEQEAKKISQKILDKRLAACINFSSIQSWYWWQGRQVHDHEVATFIKTQKKHYKKIETLIKKYHSYSIPCIMEIPIDRVSYSYKRWIHAETK